MCADKNPLMDYCDDVEDFLDRVTDDLHRIINDGEVSDEMQCHLEQAEEELIIVWKLLRERK